MGRGCAMLTALGFALLVAACGTSSSAPSATNDAAVGVETSTSGCQPGELIADDGHCEPAGIPPSMCGAGFEPDGKRGCNAILPSDPCPLGQMAIPGETACHDVAPCGNGTWGDIPVEANTQFVDQSFTGTSDGSMKAPWKKIQDGIDAAEPKAIVAVAAGSYAENVVIGTPASFAGKPVRLWGVCPSKVEIVGSASARAAVEVLLRAVQSEVRGLAVRGPKVGLHVEGSTGVLAEEVWIHDTEDRGVEAIASRSAPPGETSLILRHSLVERARSTGVFVLGGCDATIESSVVRDGRPDASDQTFGAGIVLNWNGDKRANLTLSTSLIEHNRFAGVALEGSDATIEDTLIRNTQPQASDSQHGRGLNANFSGGFRSSLTVRRSLVENSQEFGIVVAGSDVTIEATSVRDTQPQQSDRQFGMGVDVEDVTGQRGALTIRASLLEANHQIGLFVMGSDATIESVLVRGTLPQASDGALGYGIDVQGDLDYKTRSTATLRGSLVEASTMLGVLVDSSDVGIQGLLVRQTSAQVSDGLYGDGISIGTAMDRASVDIVGSRIEASVRAGISNFGADVQLGSTTLECNSLALDGETSDDDGGASSFSFRDLGGNACGCSGTTIACQVLSSGLAPPALPPAH